MDAPAGNGLTRRDFAKTAAAAAAVPLLTSLGACAAPGAAPPAPAPDAGGAAPAAGGAGSDARANAVADALTEVVRDRYGERLDAAQLETVRGSIRSNLGTARRLREFPLPISTEPVLGIPVPPPTAS
ncbi:MAG TPA: hypothetical protein VFX29_06125 [Longimicrobiaceae bacterium]|nr:hypothetical protein [Longimicrobiaceae bacterium]